MGRRLSQRARARPVRVRCASRRNRRCDDDDHDDDRRLRIDDLLRERQHCGDGDGRRAARTRPPARSSISDSFHDFTCPDQLSGSNVVTCTGGYTNIGEDSFSASYGGNSSFRFVDRHDASRRDDRDRRALCERDGGDGWRKDDGHRAGDPVDRREHERDADDL